MPFTIVSKNTVEPNFESDSYRERAQNSFQRRMAYNPRESLNQTKQDDITSSVQSLLDHGQQVHLKVNSNQPGSILRQNFSTEDLRPKKVIAKSVHQKSKTQKTTRHA